MSPPSDPGASDPDASVPGASRAWDRLGAAEDVEAPAQVPPAPPAELGGRLHPAALVLWPFRQVGPLLFLLVAGRLEPVVGGGILVALVLSSVVRWLRYSWRLERGALVIEQGLLERRRRVIPRERIQTVDLVRKLRHRALGVAEVRVEAVGGSDTEGKLEALSPEVARRLRGILLDDATPGGSDRRDDLSGERLVEVPPRRLVVAGLTGGRVGVMAALLGFAQELLGDRIDELAARAPAVLGFQGIVAVVAVVLVVAFALSIVATIVAYWGFTLAIDGPRLRIRRGLLEQRLGTIPLRRIQAVRVEENLVRRGLGLAAVKVDVAGRAGGEEGQTGLLLPLGTREEAFALVARVLDATGRSDARDVRLSPMPRRARDRRLTRAVLPVLLGTAVLVWWQGPVWTALLLLLVPAVAIGFDAYRALGVGRSGDVIVTRNGVLVRRTAFVPVDRLQSLALTASPVQRRQRLATVQLQVARSPGVWSGPQMVDVAAEEGHRWLERLADETSRRAGSVPGG